MSDLQDQACHLYDQADKLRSSRNCGSNTSSSQSASDWQDQSHMATQSNDYYSGSGQYATQNDNGGAKGSNGDIERRWQRW
ncbi:uncharacterized protein ACHE_10451A [Aspergillus chevalieri]|uniref:Uncharacterized protein n=2 Tax=Aspergillus subgen. Aspergillus TaxID=2720874 RepID=A0A1E3BCS9_ASPCR|nr:uncharacterized protein ACHE_10451A [Aspergillus chevalieri]ODM18581.1 hypothetical protein SI65_05198 [Aspergillus cristatus]BCR83049.1 hypothetical protein ACHE_10451A [Aspergillus chevalieri]